MNSSDVFRQRIYPKECVCLKDDEILVFDQDASRLVTKWQAIKPRKDLHHGYSAYIYDEGFKLSKFYNADGQLNYWYIDIIDVTYPACVDTNSCKNLPKEIVSPTMNGCFLCTDLLADVLIYPDGKVEVVDLGELADMYEQGALSNAQLLDAIRRLDHLLQLIYSGKIKEYMTYLESFETES